LMKSRRRIASPRGLRSAPTVAYTDAITAGICYWRNRVQGSVCAAAIRNRPCPLWVKSRHRGTSNQCLLYPQKRTLELSRGMSALCQKRTSRRARPVQCQPGLSGCIVVA
jgi:hypothetical protein